MTTAAPGARAVWTASLDASSAADPHPSGLTRWAVRAGGAHGEAHVPLRGASFLAHHPRLPVVYATQQTADGAVVAVRTDATPPAVRPRRASVGAFPCHLSVHPDGTWLYVANYGDGAVCAVPLDDEGDLGATTVSLGFTGTGADPRRQEASHPHATTTSPGGGFLVAADLGADVLRAYRLDGGRPVGEPVLTRLPAGAGPRHVAWRDHTLYVTCELNGAVAVVDWDETTGRGEVVASVAATTRPPGETFYLSDVLVHGGHVIVGARGCDTLSVLVPDDGEGLVLVAEVPTLTWPNHLAVLDETLLVAATHAHRVAAHPLGGPAVVGGVGVAAEVVAPMCLLVET